LKLTAPKQREKLGEGKPETFDFLGFTHFCTRSRKWDRKTIKKRMRAKLLAIKMLRRTMHDLSLLKIQFGVIEGRDR
jgi:RNA-directed DNA polymerase